MGQLASLSVLFQAFGLLKSTQAGFLCRECGSSFTADTSRVLSYFETLKWNQVKDKEWNGIWNIYRKRTNVSEFTVRYNTIIND